MTAILPPAFADLEPWSDWCLATETLRNLRRVTSPFPDIKAFAEAVLPHVEAMTAHIDANGFPDPEAMDAPTKNLFYMLMSLAEVAPAIESYDPQATVIDGYESKRFAPDEAHRLRPAL
ncbi:hypothetical protein [Oceanicella sp. SM1341]|uniref:hypothetical protein n=1 Tax=Oceanicella sp. SM1341 TaxID=1548889 RepID=UPI000E4C1D16|nr:hypothetical protein [Oceanicella sp. SM1341]